MIISDYIFDVPNYTYITWVLGEKSDKLKVFLKTFLKHMSKGSTLWSRQLTDKGNTFLTHFTLLQVYSPSFGFEI